MTTLNARIDLAVSARLENALDLGASGKFALDWPRFLTLSSGTGANQVDQMFTDLRTIVASGNDDLDLAGGLTNGIGQTVTFARVKGIFVYSKPTNTNNINIGGGTNVFATWLGAAGNIIVVRPGGLFALAAPDATAYAVTATTGDILRVTNAAAGSTVDYEIVIMGATL